MSTQIEIGKLLKCQNPECQTEFRWIPRNSTIKPKFCPRCTALKKFEQDRITYNKKMLERSNLASYRSKFQQKRDKYPIKKKNGAKAIKTPKDGFYKSTAWKWFSRYILITNTIDKDSITVRCCTCGKLMRIDSRECHLGHYDELHDIKRLPLKLDDAYLSEISETYRKKFYNYLKENNLQNPWKK
jgi:hypothetical protein